MYYVFAELIHKENKRKFLSRGTNHMSLAQSKAERVNTTHPGHLPNRPLHTMTYRNLVYFTHHDFRKIPCHLFKKNDDFLVKNERNKTQVNVLKFGAIFFIMNHVFP